MQWTKGQCDFSLAYVLRENEGDDGLNLDDYEMIDAYKEAIVPSQECFMILIIMLSSILSSLSSWEDLTGPGYRVMNKDEMVEQHG
jgi:hypothetical protein